MTDKNPADLLAQARDDLNAAYSNRGTVAESTLWCLQAVASVLIAAEIRAQRNEGTP